MIYKQADPTNLAMEPLQAARPLLMVLRRWKAKSSIYSQMIPSQTGNPDAPFTYISCCS
jgi:hypothetical protein